MVWSIKILYFVNVPFESILNNLLEFMFIVNVLYKHKSSSKFYSVANERNTLQTLLYLFKSAGANFS